MRLILITFIQSNIFKQSNTFGQVKFLLVFFEGTLHFVIIQKVTADETTLKRWPKNNQKFECLCGHVK